MNWNTTSGDIPFGFIESDGVSKERWYFQKIHAETIPMSAITNGVRVKVDMLKKESGRCQVAHGVTLLD